MMISGAGNPGALYALLMKWGWIGQLLWIPSVNGKSLIHWNLHLLAYGSILSTLSHLHLGQKRDIERRRGTRESKGDDSGIHSSDGNRATIKEDRHQEEKAMVAVLEIDGWAWKELWPALRLYYPRPFDRLLDVWGLDWSVYIVKRLINLLCRGSWILPEGCFMAE